jgi:hypothetical protein
MPNECENWVRITGSNEALEAIRVKPFTLMEWIPKPTEDTADWVLENWGTRWIAKFNAKEDDWNVELKEVEGGLEAFFESAWAPPIPFYNFLVKTIPDLQIEYEYSEWGIGFCGYGKGGEEPIHYSYHENLHELPLIRAEREWKMDLWNPHEELCCNKVK